MLKIEVKKGNLNKALKIFKKKFRDTKVLKELRDRQYYTKKSLKRRVEKDKAIRKSKQQENDE